MFTLEITFQDLPGIPIVYLLERSVIYHLSLASKTTVGADCNGTEHSQG